MEFMVKVSVKPNYRYLYKDSKEASECLGKEAQHIIEKQFGTKMFDYTVLIRKEGNK